MTRVYPKRQPHVIKPANWKHGDGSVFFTTSHSRGDRWRGVLTVKGKRHFVYAKSQDECWEKLARLRETQERLTVETWLNRWLEGLHKRTTTVRAYGDSVARIAPLLRGIMLSDLRAVDVQRALDTMRRQDGRAYSANTINRAREVLRRALNVAMKRELVTRNVAAGADALSLPGADWTGFNVWDKAQADKFLEVMRGHRLEGWFLIALIHGLRMSEILGLQWEDIDEHGTMKIRRQLQDGKLVALKTGSAAVRSIRLHPSVLHVLKRTDRREGFVFINGANHPYGATAIRRALAWGTKKAHLPRLTVHDLRHTALTILAAHGVDALTLQRMAGHASLSTTQRYIRASALDERAGEILRDVWK